MSLENEYERISGAKADLKEAIEEKGVEVGEERIDEYADKVRAIQGGGGTTVQADWAENDPEAGGYVKNRPMYTDGEGNVVMLPAEYLPDSVEEGIEAAKTAAGEAKAEAAEAKSTAEGAQTAASEAKSTASEAKTAANEAKSTASEAKTAANTAKTDAAAAKAAAAGAQEDAAGATAKAESAEAAASAAQEAADAAKSEASEAKTAAESAQTTATEAKSAAQTAQATAEAAQATADEALEAAGSGGGGSAPDLAQNDPDGEGYVKNREVWESDKYGMMLCIPEQLSKRNCPYSEIQYNGATRTLFFVRERPLNGEEVIWEADGADPNWPEKSSRTQNCYDDNFNSDATYAYRNSDGVIALLHPETTWTKNKWLVLSTSNAWTGAIEDGGEEIVLPRAGVYYSGIVNGHGSDVAQINSEWYGARRLHRCLMPNNWLLRKPTEIDNSISVPEIQILTRSDLSTKTLQIKSPKMLNGVTFTPSVAEDGTLSWTNDGEKENPEAVNIKGDKGDTPVKGVDYYTNADKAEMVEAVIAALPEAEGVSY